MDSITSGCTLGVSSPASKVPPTSSRPSSSWVATGATVPGRRSGVGSVASRWPLTWLAGRSSGSPSSSGGSPVAKTTAPGVISPEVVVTETSLSPLTVTEMAAMPVATAGRPAASRASDRSGLTLAWWRMSAPAIGRARPGTRLATSPGSSHSTAGWRWGAKPPGSGARPIQSSSTRPTPPGTLSSSWLHRSRLARASSTNGSGSLHSCGSGVSRPAAPPVAPAAQPPRLDEEHGAEIQLVAGDRGGHPRDPPAHHQDVRPRERDDAGAAAELGPFLRGELITPDSSVRNHDPILRDRIAVQHHIAPATGPAGPEIALRRPWRIG